MWIIVVAALVSVLGFVIAGIGLILLSRTQVTWLGLRQRVGVKEDPPPVAWPGPALILASGALLALGGNYKVFGLIYNRARVAEEKAVDAENRAVDRADKHARLLSTLEDPLELLWVQCQGSDPFEDRPEACSLRLRFRTRLGAQWISEVAGRQLRVPGVTLSDEQPIWHPLPWQAVLDGVHDPQQRALAGRIRAIKDLRRFNQLEAALIVRAPEDVSSPESVAIIAGFDGRVDMFGGSPVAQPISEDAACRLLVPTPLNPLQALPNLVAAYEDCWWGDVPREHAPVWAPDTVGGLVGSLATSPLAGLSLIHAVPQETTTVRIYRDDQTLPGRTAAITAEAVPAVEPGEKGGLGMPLGIALVLGVVLLIAGVNLVRKQS